MTSPRAVVPPIAPALDGLTSDGNSLYWLEGRSHGDVLVKWQAQRRLDVLPAGVFVGSTVHEYGGGAYHVRDGRVWFVRADDQQVWCFTPIGMSRLTTPPADRENRYADLSVTSSGLLLCVRESHRNGHVANELVAMPADGSEEPTSIVNGEDFYAAPRPNPDGTRLAWLSWNRPNMPWDGTCLWTADLHPDGTIGPAQLIAGGTDESVCQPLWTANGILHFISDRTGWWNLYRVDHDGVRPAITLDAELATAPWEFGYSTYQFLDSERIATITQLGNRYDIDVWHTDTGQHRRLRQPYTTVKPYLCTYRAQLAAIAADVATGPRVTLIEPDTGCACELTKAPPPHGTLQPQRAEVLTIPTRHGDIVHALYYPPVAPAHGTEPPAMLVRAHPGPTSNAQLRFDPWITFFINQRFAVLDVDYHGSTGYGRTFRNALRAKWGELDATDCIDAAQHVVDLGLADAHRLAICGSSAGGYTALQAIANTNTFAAAAIRHTLVDPTQWRNDAPKFHRHHADLLIGPQNDNSADRARSVMDAASMIITPVHLIHGEQDTVTPIAAVVRLATLLGSSTSLLTFPDEGHGLRNPEHTTRGLISELEHFNHHLRAN